jgi:hypothetical protein
LFSENNELAGNSFYSINDFFVEVSTGKSNGKACSIKVISAEELSKDYLALISLKTHAPKLSFLKLHHLQDFVLLTLLFGLKQFNFRSYKMKKLSQKG